MRKGIVLMLALAIIGAAFLALPANVSAEAQVPVWNIGDGWYFGNTADFSEMQAEIDQELNSAITQYPGFDANVDVSGGIGLYMGVEVLSDSESVNDKTCYWVKLTGALGIDFSIDISVDGTTDQSYGGMSIHLSVDGSADALVTGEATLDGNLYFTVDELAFVKGDITYTMNVDAQINANVDIQMSTTGLEYNQNIDTTIVADISLNVNEVQITGSIECNPPIDVFDFPINEYESWYVPEEYTDVTTSLSGSGTIITDAVITGLTGVYPGLTDVNEHQTVNIAEEMGTQGGITPIYDMVMFTCIASDGTNYIIETDTGEIINYIDIPGTRQFGLNPADFVEDIAPSAGFQYNENDGFVTGMTMNGQVETQTVTKADVETFVADPKGEVIAETGGASTGAALGALLLIGIIVIVVIFVVVIIVVSKRKKSGPEDVYGAQQPPPYQPPPQYPPQQPPPPPQQPPYQPPPPPPPEGQ